MRFRSIILLGGKTATGIPVPEEIVTALNSSRRPAVTVTINGYTYRSTITSMGGEFMLLVSAENREKANVAAGDEVEVELDTARREVKIPSKFAAALENNATALQFFDGLSYSKKQQYLIPIEQAKTDKTRQRRIEKAINLLQEGPD